MADFSATTANAHSLADTNRAPSDHNRANNNVADSGAPNTDHRAAAYPDLPDADPSALINSPSQADPAAADSDAATTDVADSD